MNWAVAAIGIWVLSTSVLVLSHPVDGDGKLNEIKADLNSTASRNAKNLWPLLTVISFANDGCLAVSVRSSRMGTCYTLKQCLRNGGTVTGECARGFGVCCVFEVTCGGRSAENCTYFVSPGFANRFVLPANSSAQCDLEIAKSRSDICQIRLDFVDFELFGVQEGECQIDMLSVLNAGFSASSLPQLCGINSGQHVYLDVPPGTDSIQLRAIFQYLFDNPEFSRRFEIKITQIECSNPLLAPPGCLQYFTGPTGNLKSFNYVSTSALVEGYPINQNYGICIRKELGYCSIRYSPTGTFQFGISDGDDTAIHTGSDCTPSGNRDDFLVIPGGSGLFPPPNTADRYCGGAFFPITTSAMPYIINVISGDKFDGEVGFMLEYQQLPCN